MNTMAIKALVILSVLLALGITCLYTTSLSYPYCLVMEPAWMKAKTRHELEARLVAFYTCEPIDPELTVWRGNPPKGGQTIFRYLIFAKEPLDVIVADDGTITDMFTAYE